MVEEKRKKWCCWSRDASHSAAGRGTSREESKATSGVAQEGWLLSRAGPEGSLWVLQVLFWALFWAWPDSASTEAPDGFWAGQMLQPVAGCGCCGACWLRRCSAGPSGRSSGAQRASSGASSSFLALQGRAWGLARKDYGRVGARSRLGLLVSRCWRGKTSAVWSVRIGGVIARGESKNW
jgi:hypothetical protein